MKCIGKFDGRHHQRMARQWEPWSYTRTGSIGQHPLFYWGDAVLKGRLYPIVWFNIAQESQESFKIDPASEVWTGTFRDSHQFNPEGSNPENSLTGTIFTVARSYDFFLCSYLCFGWGSQGFFFVSFEYTPEIQHGTACYSWGLLTWTYGTVSSGFCSPGNHATNFFDKFTQKLTWNPMQAQTEPKLHLETANLEVEQVVTKRSANLKGDLQVDLEPKWSLRCSPWKFHVSDLRPNQFSLRAALKVSCFDIFNKLTSIHFFLKNYFKFSLQYLENDPLNVLYRGRLQLTAMHGRRQCNCRQGSKVTHWMF